jgi:hypothetical protein
VLPVLFFHMALSPTNNFSIIPETWMPLSFPHPQGSARNFGGFFLMSPSYSCSTSPFSLLHSLLTYLWCLPSLLTVLHTVPDWSLKMQVWFFLLHWKLFRVPNTVDSDEGQIPYSGSKALQDWALPTLPVSSNIIPAIQIFGFVGLSLTYNGSLLFTA